MKRQFRSNDECVSFLAKQGIKARLVEEYRKDVGVSFEPRVETVYGVYNEVNEKFVGYYSHTDVFEKDCETKCAEFGDGTFFDIEPIIEGNLGERPNWDEYFMTAAIWAASRSSCKHVKSGSVLVQDKHLVGTGYNGAAPNIADCCLDFGCAKELKGLEYEKSLGSGECIGIHSEMNALGHLVKRGLEGATLFTTIFPCHSCAKNLGPYGINRVVFKSTYAGSELVPTLELFERGHTKVNRLDLSPERFLDILLNRQGGKFDIWPPAERERIKNMFGESN